jgi:hypothetical protein
MRAIHSNGRHLFAQVTLLLLLSSCNEHTAEEVQATNLSVQVDNLHNEIEPAENIAENAGEISVNAAEAAGNSASVGMPTCPGDPICPNSNR